ncbi:hypothetical protein [Chromatium okenii]|uniref:hypothetical protein n=1 Tax=Chromatium okenii TaxID=61644 RepID=UPI001F5C030D|nr:hypothetical protein [Chromatium okenii]
MAGLMPRVKQHDQHDFNGFSHWLATAPNTRDSAKLDWLEAQRSAAREQCIGLELPTNKAEAWRYTNLKSLLEQDFTPAKAVIPALEVMI